MLRALLCLALAAFCTPAAVRASTTNTVLTVDEYGNVSSTNAMVTQAQIAAVAASNRVTQAELAAAQAGYQAALDLLTGVAQSMAATPIAFYSVELVGFEAAVVFDETTAKCRVCGFGQTSETANKTINGETYLCRRWLMRFAFNNDLQTVQPLVAYAQSLASAPSAEWDNLDPALVESPIPENGTWTDALGNTYDHVYGMGIWLPTSRTQGFVFVRVPNDAVSGDGSVMEFPGAKDGFNGLVQLGTNSIEFVNGVAFNAQEGGGS